MQAVGTILWKAKTDYFVPFRCSSIVPLSILSVMIFAILAALASEAFATDPAARTPNGRATAVATAQVINPFTMTSAAQTGTNMHDSAMTMLRRTTYRDCESLLGADANQTTAASCELRLIELQ